MCNAESRETPAWIRWDLIAGNLSAHIFGHILFFAPECPVGIENIIRRVVPVPGAVRMEDSRQQA